MEHDVETWVHMHDTCGRHVKGRKRWLGVLLGGIATSSVCAAVGVLRILAVVYSASRHAKRQKAEAVRFLLAA